MEELEQCTWYLNIGLTTALALRFSLSGLFRVYRLFFVYLWIDILQQVLRLLANPDRSAEIYMAGQAIKLGLSVFVVLEMYRLALAGHPALAKFGRKTVGVVLAAAAVVATSGLILDFAAPAGRSRILYRFFSLERTMDASILIFLVLISLFMTWFPVQLKRNDVFYIAGFVVYFFARSAGLFFTNILAVRFRIPLSIAMMGVACLCLLMWLLALRPERENTTTVTGHRWNPDAMDRLAHQLESINTSLMRL